MKQLFIVIASLMAFNIQTKAQSDTTTIPPIISIGIGIEKPSFFADYTTFYNPYIVYGIRAGTSLRYWDTYSYGFDRRIDFIATPYLRLYTKEFSGAKLYIGAGYNLTIAYHMEKFNTNDPVNTYTETFKNSEIHGGIQAKIKNRLINLEFSNGYSAARLSMTFNLNQNDKS